MPLILWSLGANVNTHATGLVSPLWNAVREKNIPMVRFLVSHGARMNSPKSYYGLTPFHNAVKQGDLEMIRYMINEGGEFTVKDNEEWHEKSNGSRNF